MKSPSAINADKPAIVSYGFDWQEGRQVGDAFYEECAKTVTTTKPGGVLVLLKESKTDDDNTVR